MSDTILLRHFPLNGRHFQRQDCDNMFAFREFGSEDSEELKHKVGIECDRITFVEHMSGTVNFKALVYGLEPTRVLRYVFDTRDAMGCIYNKDTNTYYDSAENYYSNGMQYLTLVDEATAVKQQFSRSTAHYLCRKKGLLYRVLHSDKVLLQRYMPDRHFFQFVDCTNVYAFRELKHGANREMLKQGVYCDRDKYLALMHGDTHFHAITYYKSFSVGNVTAYNTMQYVFSALNDMNCTVPSFAYYNGYSDFRSKYTNNDKPLHYYTNEDSAITSVFSRWDANAVCNNSGLLPFQFAWLDGQKNVTISTMSQAYYSRLVTNVTLLINTTTTMPTTVPIGEMEFLSSAATLLLSSPLVLVPVMLAIENVTNMFFDGLANWLVNFTKKE